LAAESRLFAFLGNFAAENIKIQPFSV